MKRLGLALALALWAGPALAQNVTCSTRPAGDSSNACASTAFVTSAVAAGGGGGGGVTSIQGMTGALTCGANMVCSGGVINSGASGSAPALGPAHIFVGNSSAVAADFGPTILISTQVASFVQNVSIGVDDHTNPTTATLTVGGPTSTLPISPIPDTYIQISGDDQHNARLVIDAIGPGTGPAIWGRSARGNVVNGPTPPLSGDAMLSLFAIGFRSGGIYGGAASISFNAAEDHTASVGGSAIKVFTTPLGSLSLQEIARFQPSGGFSVGTDNVATDPGNNNVRTTGLTLSGITGSTQCLQVNNAGTVVGAGTPCGIPILPLLHSHIFVGTPAGISADFGPQVTFADNGLMTFAINTGGVGNFYNVMSSTVPLNTAVIAWRLTDNVNNTVDFGLTGNGAPAPFTGTSFIRSSGNFIIDANTPSAIIFGIGLVEAGRWDQNGHLQLTYLQGGGNQCLTINGAGVVSGTGASCGGSGGGGGGIGNITTTDNTLLSSGTTTVNLGINLAHANVWTATQTLSGLTLSSITGSIQCLHVSAIGVVTGTGSDCGSGGGGAVNSVTNADGSLTISPTTGAVVASLNLAHSNNWTAPQTLNTVSAAAINITGSNPTQNEGITITNTSPTGNATVLLYNDAGLGGALYSQGSGSTGGSANALVLQNFTSTGILTLGAGGGRVLLFPSGGVVIGSGSDPGTNNLRIGGITGATRCLHVDTAGNVSGTASDCGATAVGGGVTGVTSPGGTLTVGGTTGVTVDLNTGHANTWTAEQDFTLTQNGSTLFQASNGSSGTTALAGFQANAVGSAISVGATGSGYTALPILGSGRAFVLSAAVPLVLDTNGIFPLIFGINNIEVARFNGTGLSIQPSGQGVAPDAPLTVNANTVAAPVVPDINGVHVVGANGALAGIELDAFGTGFPYIGGRRHEGTAAAPTAVLKDDALLFFQGKGFQGGGVYGGGYASIVMSAGENFSSGHNGTYISFGTTPISAVNTTETMRITNAGVGIAVNNAGGAAMSTDAALTINFNTVAIGNPLGGTPGPAIHITGSDTSGSSIVMDAFGTGHSNYYFGRYAGGTAAAKTVADVGQTAFTVGAQGFNGTDNTSFAQINFITAEAFSATNAGGFIDFYTNPIGSRGLIGAMRIQASGGLSVGSANVTTDGGNGVIVATKAALGASLVPDAPLTVNANTAATVAPLSGTVLHLVGGNSQSLTAITIDAFSSIPYIGARAAAGTLAAKVALPINAQALNIGGYGWNGSTYQALSAITMNASEAIGPNNNGSNIQFFTNALGAANVRSVMIIQGSGGLSVGTANINTDGGNGVITANKIAFTGIATLAPGSGSPACIHASGELYKSSGGTC